MRKPYRFTLDMVKHKDLIEFLEDFSRFERGKCVIEALRLYKNKFMAADDKKESRKIDMGKILG